MQGADENLHKFWPKILKEIYSLEEHGLHKEEYYNEYKLNILGEN
jgi:hypothetical protein